MELQLPENFGLLAIKGLVQGLQKVCQESKIQIVGGILLFLKV